MSLFLVNYCRNWLFAFENRHTLRSTFSQPTDLCNQRQWVRGFKGSKATKSCSLLFQQQTGSGSGSPWFIPLAPAALLSVDLFFLFTQAERRTNCLSHSALLWFSVNTFMTPHTSCSALLPSLPMLPASQILEGSYGGIRCHQPVSHPLVDQGGVSSHRTQQHGEASVQHVTYAARQRGGSCEFGKNLGRQLATVTVHK